MLLIFIQTRAHGRELSAPSPTPRALSPEPSAERPQPSAPIPQPRSLSPEPSAPSPHPRAPGRELSATSSHPSPARSIAPHGINIDVVTSNFDDTCLRHPLPNDESHAAETREPNRTYMYVCTYVCAYMYLCMYMCNGVAGVG